MFLKKNLEKSLAQLSLYERLRLVNSKNVEGKFEDFESTTILGGIKRKKRGRLNAINQTDKFLYTFSDEEKEVKEIKIHGPFQGIPEFIVISNLDEKRELEKYGKPHILQEQLIILDDFHYHRYLNDLGIQTDISGLYFINNSGLKEDGSYFEPPEEWLSSLYSMLEKFVKKGGIHGDSEDIDHRIIFGSDYGRNKILEVFEKLGLERI